jgi:type IV secretory pathway TrbL component
MEDAGLPCSGLLFDDFTSYVQNGRKALAACEGLLEAPPQPLEAEKQISSEKTTESPQRPRLAEAAYQNSRALQVSQNVTTASKERSTASRNGKGKGKGQQCCSIQ